MSTPTQDQLPPLSSGARRNVALRILSLVAQHDGDWYWYQVDRLLSGEHTGPFFTEIDALVSAGLIIAASVPEPGGVRYRLTEAGRLLFPVHAA